VTDGLVASHSKSVWRRGRSRAHGKVATSRILTCLKPTSVRNAALKPNVCEEMIVTDGGASRDGPCPKVKEAKENKKSPTPLYSRANKSVERGANLSGS